MKIFIYSSRIILRETICISLPKQTTPGPRGPLPPHAHSPSRHLYTHSLVIIKHWSWSAQTPDRLQHSDIVYHCILTANEMSLARPIASDNISMVGDTAPIISSYAQPTTCEPMASTYHAFGILLCFRVVSIILSEPELSCRWECKWRRGNFKVFLFINNIKYYVDVLNSKVE